MLLELPPDGWRSNILDVGIRDLPRGIVDGDSALKAFFPEGVRAQWTAARSFNLVVHKNRRSIHPDAAYVSLKATRFIRGLTPYQFFRAWPTLFASLLRRDRNKAATSIWAVVGWVSDGVGRKLS
jgi:hypothetical protein